MHAFGIPLLGALVAFLPCSASAQNMLVNPDFDATSTLSGWFYFSGPGPEPTGQVDCTGPTCETFSWIADDECCSVPASGSMESISSLTTRNNLAQCITGINAGHGYDFGAWLRAPQPLDPAFIAVYARIVVQWHATPDCSARIDSVESAIEPVQTWRHDTLLHAVAPSGTQSALFVLRHGPTGLSPYANLVTRVDGAHFAPDGSVPVTLQRFSVD